MTIVEEITELLLHIYRYFAQFTDIGAWLADLWRNITGWFA